MSKSTHHTSGAADLPEALRVPLDSLHADAGYLCGRLLNGSLTQEQVVESIRRRIDAAKLASLTAQAISAEPAAHVQNPAENEHVAGDVSGNGAESNTAYAALPEPESYGTRNGRMDPKQPLFTEDDMQDHADRTHALRAEALAAAYREELDKLSQRNYELRFASHGQAPATQQAGATKEHVRLVRVIADKIEDGTLFRSGIYSNKDLARFVRNVADAAAPQFPTAQAAESAGWDADRIVKWSDRIQRAHPKSEPEFWPDALRVKYMADEISDLRAARAPADSVLEDAARYQWLRHGDNDEKVLCNGPVDKSYWYLLRNEKLDTAIDEARKQGGA